MNWGSNQDLSDSKDHILRNLTISLLLTSLLDEKLMFLNAMIL